MPIADMGEDPDLSAWPLAGWRLLGERQIIEDFFEAQHLMLNKGVGRDRETYLRVLSVAPRAEQALDEQRRRALAGEPLLDVDDETWKALWVADNERLVKPIPG